MATFKKNLLIYGLVFFSIFISIIFWKILHLPYNSEIIGEYSIKNYNALNDVIKYLFFILFPLSIFFIAKILIDKKNILHSLQNIKIERNFSSNKAFSLDIIFFSTFFLFILFEFFSLSWSEYQIDIFHTGQKLYPAFRYSLDGSLWSGSYLIVGLFYEVLLTKLSWDFLGIQSIGAAIVGETILNFITKLFIIFLIFQISKLTNLSNNLKILFFFILSYLSHNLIDLDINTGDLIWWRDLPVLITLSLFISIINHPSKNLFLSISLGFIFVSLFLWSIDRAIINSGLVIIILIIFIYNKLYNHLITFFLSIILFTITFYFLLGEEFKYFLDNTFLIFKEMTNIHGIIHPIPFSEEPNASRATKTIISILTTLIISINLILTNKKKINNNFNIVLLIISILAFFYYINAIGRSDGGHIKQGFAAPISYLSIIITYYILQVLNKFINLERILTNKSKLLMIPLFLSLFLTYNLNLNNIINFNKNISKFIKLDDKFFLSKEDSEFVDKAFEISNDYKCIQLYSNDAILLYLLKKPSCSKYYWTWSYGSKNAQSEIIKELKKTNLIISKGRTDDWGIPFNLRFKLLDTYIHENYKTKKIKIGQRELRFKN